MELLEDRAIPAAFTAGNLAILIADSFSASNTTVTIREIDTTTANQTVTNKVAIDGTGPNAIRLNGSSTSTGYLSHSDDGSLLTFTGAKSTDTTTSVASLNPRAAVTLNAGGTVSIATTYTGAIGNHTRSATSLNNTTWFISDQGGIYTNGSTSASPSANTRAIKSFGGVVYVGQQLAAAIQVSTVSAATGGVITGLPGLASNTSFQDFYLIQSGDNGSTYDVLYILSSTSPTTGTITKFSLVSGSWVANGSYTTTFGGFGLAAADNGNGAFLYATSGFGATPINNVIKLADTAGYNSPISITTANNVTLFTAGVGTTIKGIDFTPVPNAPPVNSVPVSQTTNEDAPLTFSTANGNAVSISDPDAGTKEVKVTLIATNGTITLGATGGLTITSGANNSPTMTFTGTLANINAALSGLQFAPSANHNGGASLSITTNDQGNTGSGGLKTDTDVISITVNPVNDAPTLTGANNFTAIDEDVADADNHGDLLSALTAGGVAEADSAPLFGIAITGLGGTSSGIWQYSTNNGSSWTDVGSVSESQALLLKADTQTRLRFVPNTNFNGTISPGVTLRAWDQTSGVAETKVNITATGGSSAFSIATASANITVNAVDNGPSIQAPLTASVDEDADLTFSTANGNAIAISDVDAVTNEVKVTLASTNGIFTLSGTNGLHFSSGGNGTAAMTFTGTLADIAAALASSVFTPDRNYFGAASLKIDVDDQGFTGSGGPKNASKTIAITVNAVNDEPTFDLGADVTVDEDAGSQSITGFASNILAGPSNESAQTLSFSLANNNDSLFSEQPSIDSGGELTFTLKDNAHGTAVVEVTLTDGGSNVAPNDNNSKKTFRIIVNPVADTPGVTPAATDEETPTSTGLLVTRNMADGDEVTHFRVTGITGGTLYRADGSTEVGEGEFIEFAADGTYQLYFLPDLDQNDDTGGFGFDVQASLDGDESGLGGSIVTADITVGPVNDAPTFDITGDVSVDEDAGAQTITGFASNFQPGPADATDEVAQTPTYTVKVLSTTGNLAFAAAPTIDAHGNLTFTTADDANGTATVEVTVTDSGDGTSPNANTGAPQTFTITVNAVNDTPGFALAGDVFARQDSGTTTLANFATFFPGGAADEAAQVPAYTLDVTDPSLFSVPPAIDAGGTLSFTLAPGAAGPVTVFVTVRDGGGTDRDGVDTSPTQVFTIQVAPRLLPPAPALVGSAPQIIAVGSDAGPQSRVRVLNAQTGGVVNDLVPFAGFTGGVRVATGDVNGDRQGDVIVATATGNSHVKVLTAGGAELMSFLAFPGFAGGLSVAAGDVDRDGRADVVVGTATGSTHVEVFSGLTGGLIRSFMAFDGFTGGVRVAAGDVNGDGYADIAAVAGPGGSGHVKVFDGRTGQILVSFLGYPGYSGEINLAMGDLTGDGLAEIITVARNAAMGAHVKAVTSQAELVRSFFAPVSAGLGGTDGVGTSASGVPRVAAADVTGDNVADFLLGDPLGAAPSRLLLVDGATSKVVRSDFAFDPLFGFGVFVDM
jgi:hypothetical protein